MAHALNAEALPIEVLGPQSAADDLLDIQDLWPITTDLTDAATRVTNAIHDIASALSQDTEAPASLRQQLLEIRARLVYAYFDICSNIISVTTVLISRAAFTAASNLRDAPSTSGTTRFQQMVAAILSGCASSHRLLGDALDAWGSFSDSLSQFYAARSRSAQSGVVAFLRNIGTIASPAPSPSRAEPSRDVSCGVAVRDDLATMLQSLGRIEAFWRKRQALFAEQNHTFRREDLLRLQSIQQLGDAYLDFIDPLTQGEQDLSRPQPALVRSPHALDESVKKELSWRALVQP